MLFYDYKFNNLKKVRKEERMLNLSRQIMTPKDVTEPSDEHKKEIIELLAFKRTPSPNELKERAKRLAEIAEEEGCDSVLIGAACFLMPPLVNALEKKGIVPFFDFSLLKITTKVPCDGGEISESISYEHEGFIRAF